HFDAIPTTELMNTKVCLCLLALVACVAAQYAPPRPSYSAPRDQPSRETYDYDSVEVKYDSGYEVKDQYSGNDFNHQESRDGEQTQGSYSVQLPDGRLQTVTYYVDGDGGYVANVEYQGEAQYPSEEESDERYSAPAPARYSAPAPTPAPRKYSPPRNTYNA
ncbi:unnamed protein product, partial [Meganyctiphanes norvegica]